MNRTVLVASAMARPSIEPLLPDWVEPRFFNTTEELFQLAPEAEIGWFDTYKREDMAKAIISAERLKWLSSIYAGVDGFPLDVMRERGVRFTNGAGLLSDPIAEYVILGMLSVAKGYHKVLQAQARKEWLQLPPGQMELEGAQVLILGYGGIGQAVEKRLLPFGAIITKVRRTPSADTLGPDEWRSKLGQFDWIIVTAPATSATRHMIGREEFAAMKPGAAILNVARGSLIDQAALLDALRSGQVGHAFLDVTDPEPLPADNPLWDAENVQISMHLSGPSQSSMFRRATARFLDNLARFEKDEPLEPLVDLVLGY